jgi:hypothetical protein
MPSRYALGRRLGGCRPVVDGLMVLAVWVIAAGVRGRFGVAVAELITCLVIAGWLLRLIQRGRAEQMTAIGSLQRADASDRRDRAAIGRLGLVVLIGGGIVVQATFPHAPSTSELPIAEHARVIASVSAGSDIDTASDHGRYRYMAIAGPAGLRGARLLSEERHHLLRVGWRCADAANVRPVPCSRNEPGTATLLAPKRSLRVYLQVVTSQPDADQQFNGEPLEGNAAIRRALRKHEPLLSVLLANRR